eukprot:11333305-Karenia_brevis.AAC.1
MAHGSKSSPVRQRSTSYERHGKKSTIHPGARARYGCTHGNTSSITTQACLRCHPRFSSN